MAVLAATALEMHFSLFVQAMVSLVQSRPSVALSMGSPSATQMARFGAFAFPTISASLVQGIDSPLAAALYWQISWPLVA